MVQSMVDTLSPKKNFLSARMFDKEAWEKAG
jgi:hypothetical protein